MHKFRTQLLATAAIVALGGSAHAADLAIKGAATVPAVPYAQWEGAYLGGHIGIASQDASCTNEGYYLGPACGALKESEVTRNTGVVAGVQRRV